MTLPTDYIFKSGSCAKNALFDLIVNSLKDQGWTDISSNPTTDYIVLSSNGNSGDKNLILNLRDTNATGANSVKTTAYNQMSFRLQDTYTPNPTAGQSGTFGRTSLAWTELFLAPVAAAGTLAGDTVVNYKIYTDASKIIMSIEYPPATGYSPVLFYLGLPDSTYLRQSGAKGMLYASTVNMGTASNLLICNSPDTIGVVTAPYVMPTLATTVLKNPNNDGVYTESPVYYQSITEGLRGKLDGVFCMTNSNILTGDTLTINSNTYYALVCHVQGNSSFPTQALLIRTA